MRRSRVRILQKLDHLAGRGNVGSSCFSRRAFLYLNKSGMFHQALIRDPINRVPINRVSPPGTLPRPLKNIILNNFGGLLGVPGPRRHAYYHCVKFALWETPYSSKNDHFRVPCCPCYRKCKFSLMKFSELGRMAISNDDFGVSLLLCGSEIGIWVYHLLRMNVLRICGFSYIC